MSRTIYKLTATKVRQATAAGLHGDGGSLYMQVSKTSAKSWIFRYDFDGKRHEMGLGACQTVDLAEAREAARACRQALRDKGDPLAERKAVHTERALARAKRITFNQCATAYRRAPQQLEERQARGPMGSTLATYASPVIGSLAVAHVDGAGRQDPQPHLDRKDLDGNPVARAYRIDSRLGHHQQIPPGRLPRKVTRPHG